MRRPRWVAAKHHKNNADINSAFRKNKAVAQKAAALFLQKVIGYIQRKKLLDIIKTMLSVKKILDRWRPSAILQAGDRIVVAAHVREIRGEAREMLTVTTSAMITAKQAAQILHDVARRIELSGFSPGALNYYEWNEQGSDQAAANDGSKPKPA